MQLDTAKAASKTGQLTQEESTLIQSLVSRKGIESSITHQDSLKTKKFERTIDRGNKDKVKKALERKNLSHEARNILLSIPV